MQTVAHAETEPQDSLFNCLHNLLDCFREAFGYQKLVVLEDSLL